jgi:hypothetical protein
MTEFANQSIGSHDKGAAISHEYVHVWFDETEVTGFWFHSIGANDCHGAYHGIHGITVDARHIWAAIFAFSKSPDMAVRADGSKFYVSEVWCRDGSRELRQGGKYGKCVARMTPTGYVQHAA